MFLLFFQYKELLKNLVLRDLKVRYKRSVLGVFWALLEPLILMILFTVVFSFVLRIKVEKYPVFVLCGLLPWSFFSTGLSYSSTSISEHANLIKKIYFPREIIPPGGDLSPPGEFPHIPGTPLHLHARLQGKVHSLPHLLAPDHSPQAPPDNRCWR
ncbi:MAG: hypothetical protein DRG40_05880 [Deltaproteobacteria bacterium]|nr:MAG: hypothetical protein DRG40_05880 [Deltaproteobacteria bacterium]